MGVVCWFWVCFIVGIVVVVGFVVVGIVVVGIVVVGFAVGFMGGFLWCFLTFDLFILNLLRRDLINGEVCPCIFCLPYLSRSFSMLVCVLGLKDTTIIFIIVRLLSFLLWSTLVLLWLCVNCTICLMRFLSTSILRI